MKSKRVYVELLFNHPIDKSFTYHYDIDTKNIPDIGKRAIANFNNNEMMGFIISTSYKKPDFNTKPIEKLLDEKQVFTQLQINLADWIARFNHCSRGESLSIMVPKEKNPKKVVVPAPNECEPLLTLNDEQTFAVSSVREAIEEGKSESFLLHGITGSGKTEVYKHLAKKTYELGRQTLILVPEIALTPQTMSRFVRNFGSRVAILHSKVNPREKLYIYRQILEKEVDIILGARSAMFAPFNNLGLIIIDEEHETSYKSSDTPRYHARQVGYYLSKELSVPIVLGSATPSLETYYRSINKQIVYLPLVKRHSAHDEPEITVIDLKDEWAQGYKKFALGMITEPLSYKILDRLDKKEQVIIFLNRRGYSTGIVCMDCGAMINCPNCGIAMTYHNTINLAVCHYCNHQIKPPSSCVDCGSKKLNYKGFGTQKVFENLQSLFPDARIERMDLDSVRSKYSYDLIYARLREHDIDIIVGTQMIAKGLHIPNITLCGVLMADSSLMIPDFRASERTFSLITQVSGRVGRGEKKGEVVIQAFNPEHYSIQTAIKNDYYGFAKQELSERKNYDLPPFIRFAKLLVRGTDKNYVHLRMEELGKVLSRKQIKGVEFLGPSPCPMPKINKNYRWHLILKTHNLSRVHGLIDTARNMLQSDSKLYLEIDIDPISLM